MIKIVVHVYGYFLFREMGYDGIVLESWSRWAAHGILHDSNMRGLVSFQSLFLPSQYSLSPSHSALSYFLLISLYLWLFATNVCCDVKPLTFIFDLLDT